MHNSDLLTKLGLSKQESTIYLALLEHGDGTVSSIAKWSALFRPVIYKTLPSLVEKQLVSVFPKGKQKHYRAESPSRLQTQVERLVEEFEVALPELEANFAHRDKKPNVTFLEGNKALRTIFTDLVRTLPRGGVFYRYSSTKDGKRGSKYLPADYREMRDQKQLERFVITSEEGAKYKKNRMERSIKVVPKDEGLFDYDITQIIYGNKVVFIDDNSETAIVIQNPIIAEFQTKLFKLLWKRL